MFLRTKCSLGECPFSSHSLSHHYHRVTISKKRFDNLTGNGKLETKPCLSSSELIKIIKSTRIKENCCKLSSCMIYLYSRSLHLIEMYARQIFATHSFLLLFLCSSSNCKLEVANFRCLSNFAARRADLGVRRSNDL